MAEETQLPAAPPVGEEPTQCPDCGANLQTASALVDHSLSEHVQAPTPAEHIRPIKHPTALRVIFAIGLLVGLAGWVLVAMESSGTFDSPSAPETPSSVVHEVVVELEAEGEIDNYRAVEPESGWDTEYEINDGDGYIRIRGEGTPTEDVEFYAFGFDDTEGAIEDALEARGFLFEN